MKTPGTRTLAPLALALACACSGGGGSSLPGGPGTSEDVRLLRDAFGVPHVYAESDAGAFFGLGWAMAEDRLFQMCFERVLLQGRLAEFLGRGADDQFLDHDREYRAFGYARAAERMVGELDAETRGLLEAYARGVNQAAADPDTLRHPLFASTGFPDPVAEPWTAADCVGAWMLTGIAFHPPPLGKAKALHEFEAVVELAGGDVDLALECYASLVQGEIDDDAAAVAEADVPAARKQAILDYAAGLGLGLETLQEGFAYEHLAPKFSHAWVVNGERSATGAPLLFSDPQSRITIPSTLAEWHVVGETFDVRGAGRPGSANLVVGSTPDVAWGATALGGDFGDLFELVVDDPGAPTAYELDGEMIPFEVVELEEIQVQGQSPVTFLYRETVWGPVVTDVVEDVQPDEAFAAKSVLIEPGEVPSVAGFLAMYRAKDAAAFGAALGGWRVPTANVVFADAAGSIGYWAKGPIPIRSPLSPRGGRMAQDGSLSASDWVDLIPHDLMPWVIDPAAGHVLSANHLPVGSWYPLPLALGTGGRGDTMRSRRLRELLEADDVFDVAEFSAIHTDTVHPSRRDLARLGVFLRDVQGVFSLPGLPPSAVNAELALEVLDDWLAQGASMAGTHPGAALAFRMNVKFRGQAVLDCAISPPGDCDATCQLNEIWGSGDNGLQAFLKAKVVQIEAAAPAPLSDAEIEYVLGVLADAYRDSGSGVPGIVDCAGSADPADWLAWYEDNVLTEELTEWTFPFSQLAKVGECPPDPTTSASLTGQEVVVGPVVCADGGTILSQLGQMYTHRVVFGADEPPISLLPLGQSEHVSSGHAQDQTALFEAGGHKDVLVDLEALLAAGATETALVFAP